MRAFDFRPVLCLGAVTAEVALLLAIMASHVLRIARLVTFLGYMTFNATVAADIGTASGAVFGKMTHCKQSGDVRTER